MRALGILNCILLAAVSLLSSVVLAQPYPSKQLIFVVPFIAGSATDQQARVIAQGITESTGIPVIIDNKVGANGFIAAQAVTSSSPDGLETF